MTGATRVNRPVAGAQEGADFDGGVGGHGDADLVAHAVAVDVAGQQSAQPRPGRGDVGRGRGRAVDGAVDHGDVVAAVSVHIAGGDLRVDALAGRAVAAVGHLPAEIALFCGALFCGEEPVVFVVQQPLQRGVAGSVRCRRQDGEVGLAVAVEVAGQHLIGRSHHLTGLHPGRDGPLGDMLVLGQRVDRKRGRPQFRTRERAIASVR